MAVGGSLIISGPPGRPRLGGGPGVDRVCKRQELLGSHPCHLVHSLKRPWPREWGVHFVCLWPHLFFGGFYRNGGGRD